MIQVLINNIDRTSDIIASSLSVSQNLTNEVDTAQFSIRKYGSRTYTPTINEEVKIFDGTTQIFGGLIRRFNESIETSNKVVYNIQCSDYSSMMDKLLVARVYENLSVKDIITAMLADYAVDFNANNVLCELEIDKIVFNQVPVSQCISRLAKLVKYEWYVDENKSINFFQINDKVAPFGLTDDGGKYVYSSLTRGSDGTQIVNRVKVRGGEYNGSLYTDSITVSGSDTKSFILPYKFANLAISVNDVSKVVGIDNIDDFTSKDVLYNFEEKTFRFNTALSAGDIIEFSGNPKVRVFAVAEDLESIATYGKVEKLIREDDIESNALARKRAVAELYTYASEVIDASFFTREAGLRAGMTININSVDKGYNDDMVIKSITFKPIDYNAFGYQVNCISGKRYNLINVLALLLAPKTLKSDEREVAEDIASNQETLTIQDEVFVVNPISNDEELTIEENYIITEDEPAWVLSPYAPASQTDEKRPGRLGISMKLYDEPPFGIGFMEIENTFIIN